MDSTEAVPEDDPQADGEQDVAILQTPITAKILVVDDDAPTLYALERTLEDPTIQIVTARSGKEALKHLLRHDFALILMDARMPAMDGYETAAVIRKREKSRHIPIIFLTALDKDDLHMFRGYSAGAVDYVFKPVEPLILKSKVSVFVELYRKTEEIRREERFKRWLQAENFRMRGEKVRAERALRLSEERQSLILDSLPLALYSALPDDFHSSIRTLGDRVERMTGFPPERFREADSFWASRLHPDDRERVMQDVSEIARQGSFATDYRWQCADGSYRYFHDRAVVASDPGGVPHEIFGVWLDVTEHRQLEQQLTQSRKMEAIGQLTGGIAHDFNNMLTAVLGNLDLLNRTLEPGSKSARRADMALQSALRCAELTQRLLYFARRKHVQREPVDVNAVVNGMARMLEQILDERIEVEVRTGPGLWNVLADSSQLESSLLNLVINARDALPDGGRVVIEAANRPRGERCDDSEAEADADDYVALSVTDNGVGMPPEVIEHLFEPFFTTKEPGHGTGLGLSVIYTFVQQCGGFIRVDSEVGRGTRVSLFLKRAEKNGGSAPISGDSRETQPGARDGEVVLVTEDDSEVLKSATEILRDLGYDVVEAVNAAEALEILSSGRRVDLLFTDIAMPGGMSGRELAHSAVSRWPALRVLYTSGYANRVEDSEDEPVRARLLMKPYRDFQLARAVREALDAAPPAAGAGGG